MIAIRTSRRPVSDPTEETTEMPKPTAEIRKRLAATLAALLGAGVLLLAVLPLASASAAEPWWQILTASRPTNMWLPQDESMVQEIETEAASFFGSEIFAARVEVGGTVVGCLGGGDDFFGTSAEEVCQDETGMSADETAAELQATLEGPYGAGDVEVAGGPVAPLEGFEPFIVTTPGRWVAPVEVSVLPVFGIPAGTATATVTSEGSGRLVVSAVNLGTAPLDATSEPLAIADTLPDGMIAYGIADAQAGANRDAGPVDCSIETTSEVSCTFEGTLPAHQSIFVEIDVALTSTDPAEPGQVVVSGGDAGRATEPQRVEVSDEPTPFGVANLSVEAQREGGAPATQAGSHPFQVVTTVQMNRGPVVPGVGELDDLPGLPRDFRTRLPAGLVGNATELPRCSEEDFFSGRGACPDSTAIGVAWNDFNEPRNLHHRQIADPVFNLPPRPGQPARFGFFATGLIPVTLDPEVRIGDSYAVSVNVTDTTQIAQLYATSVSIWGVPGDPRHDGRRGECLRSAATDCSVPGEPKPFLRLPTSCTGPLGFAMEVEPWNVPRGTQVSRASTTAPALDGCNRVPFDAELSIQPTTTSADSPSGLAVRLRVPQDAAPDGISPSDVENTTVTLPEGLQVNAAAANGLAACSESQVGFSHLVPETGEAVFDDSPARCPEASKLGRVRVESPLLDEELTGAVYQAAQGDNPFGSLLAIYVVADAPRSGIHVKLAGEVEAAPNGQLTSTFSATPQLPFEEFELRLFGGAGAPLATTDCGTYATRSEIEPWSGGPAATPFSRFEITSAHGGGPCAEPRPFEPSMVAGSVEPAAGRFSPFVLRLTRPDGHQQLSRIDTVLPEGMVGKLAGIPFCAEDAIARAAGRSDPGQGRAELDDPSCPAESRVGEVRVASGVGANPVRVDGTAYLAGPYKGAPLSVAIVTPAVAGPFDAGVVVVRVALHVDPQTAQLTARSDEIPAILHGIPLNVRAIRVKVDRPEFTLNPTSCAAMQVTGTATSLAGRQAELSNRFQVGDCASLDFGPRFRFRVLGKRATKPNGHPRLTSVVTFNPGEANIAGASVTLPRRMIIDQDNIGTTCTRGQFQAGECPEETIIGSATAHSPLLDDPLNGPVYLISSENPLPDVVADLKGIVDIALFGRIHAQGIRIRNTFDVVPDAPVERFRLTIKGGPDGILVNGADLCDKPRFRRVDVSVEGHNGKSADQRRALQSNRCLRIRARELTQRARSLRQRARQAASLGRTKQARKLRQRASRLERKAERIRTNLDRQGGPARANRLAQRANNLRQRARKAARNGNRARAKKLRQRAKRLERRSERVRNRLR